MTQDKSGMMTPWLMHFTFGSFLRRIRSLEAMSRYYASYFNTALQQPVHSQRVGCLWAQQAFVITMHYNLLLELNPAECNADCHSLCQVGDPPPSIRSSIWSWAMCIRTSLMDPGCCRISSSEGCWSWPLGTAIFEQHLIDLCESPCPTTSLQHFKQEICELCCNRNATQLIP